ncbi:unnamed protein product, partial [Rotaria sordida]
MEIYEAILKHGGDFVDNVEVLKSNLVVGRDQEIQQCAEILSRQTKNNLLLIGEPGVGKTAIVKSLAQRIIHQDINDILSKRLIALDLEALFVGTSHRNELKERLKSILK